MTLPPVQIRDGSEGDLHAALSLLDDAVRWLVARGRTGQWGEKPFSEVEARVAQIRSMLADRTARIGVSDGRVVGFCVLARARDVGLLRFDCFAGNDRAFVRTYERLGFVLERALAVDTGKPEPWPGALMRMEV